MSRLPLFLILTLCAGRVLADDRGIVTHQMQELADAVAPGEAAVWDKYLDPDVIYAEEDGSYKGKAETLKEITPLPKGLGGTIKIELLSYHEQDGVAVALFRQIETEQYFGQTIHANYLTSTTWKKGVGGWKLIAEQVLAEKIDPPSITLAANRLAEYEGTYQLKDSKPVFTLKVAQGQLIGTRDSQMPATWYAEAADVFFVVGDPRIRKIFQRNKSGKIVGFIERREMWDLVWLKTS